MKSFSKCSNQCDQDT